MKRLAIPTAVFSFVFAACVSGDLNQECTLVRGNPDGGIAIPLLKTDDVIKNSANKDFVSFGSTDCEDQRCVRDSTFKDRDGDTTPYAKGYCSTSCVAGSSIGCQSYDGKLDSDAKTSLSCRPLLLDETTLAAIKAADPVRYQQTFGMTTSPYFCARGQPFDAGQ